MGELADEGDLGVGVFGASDVELVSQGDGVSSVEFVAGAGGEEVAVGVAEGVGVVDEKVADVVAQARRALDGQSQVGDVEVSVGDVVVDAAEEGGGVGDLPGPVSGGEVFDGLVESLSLGESQVGEVGVEKVTFSELGFGAAVEEFSGHGIAFEGGGDEGDGGVEGEEVDTAFLSLGATHGLPSLAYCEVEDVACGDVAVVGVGPEGVYFGYDDVSYAVDVPESAFGVVVDVPELAGQTKASGALESAALLGGVVVAVGADDGGDEVEAREIEGQGDFVSADGEGVIALVELVGQDPGLACAVEGGYEAVAGPFIESGDVAVVVVGEGFEDVLAGEVESGGGQFGECVVEVVEVPFGEEVEGPVFTLVFKVGEGFLFFLGVELFFFPAFEEVGVAEVADFEGALPVEGEELAVSP